jgi:phosphoglycolate phosphatase-like HAD superfamily hydrolase
MHVLLFDIDGTLTESQIVDGEIYVRALNVVHGFTQIDTDWSTYANTTDAGILNEVFESRRGRPPTLEEIAGFRDYFVSEIDAASARMRFKEVPGAAAALKRLAKFPQHRIGLATGGWSASARTKLRDAGIDPDAYPSASSDDGIARVDIMRCAITRIRAAAPRAEITSVVYFGDGVWDARACRDLRIPFVGIGSGARAELLRAEGAVAVMADYAEIATVAAATLAAQQRYRASEHEW